MYYFGNIGIISIYFWGDNIRIIFFHLLVVLKQIVEALREAQAVADSEAAESTFVTDTCPLGRFSAFGLFLDVSG